MKDFITPLQKLPKNVGNLGKLIVATGFEKLPKSGHTAGNRILNTRTTYF